MWDRIFPAGLEQAWLNLQAFPVEWTQEYASRIGQELGNNSVVQYLLFLAGVYLLTKFVKFAWKH